MIFLLYIGASVHAFAATEEEVATPKDAAEVYARRCSVCHGDDGSGARWAGASLKPPPRNFTDPALADSLTRAQMINGAIYGKPGTAMPAFGSRIDHQILEQVVDYIRSEFMKLPDSGNNPVGDGSDDVVIGEHITSHASVAAGGRFYSENCATCHGEDGNGDGPRAYFIFPKPINFRQHAKLGHLTRESLFVSIKHGVRGREMPAWGTVLDDREILDIVEFVYLNFVKHEQIESSVE